MENKLGNGDNGLLEKNELEDILVKLKLGTISVDDAIEQLKNNIATADNTFISIWKQFNAPFDEVIQADEIMDTQIELIIQNNLAKRVDFIFLGSEYSRFQCMKDRYKQLEYNSNSCAIYTIRKCNNISSKKVAVVYDRYSNFLVAKQVEFLLSLFGIECLMFGLTNNDVASVLDKVKQCDLTIVTEGYHYGLAYALSSQIFTPIILVPVSNNNASGNGHMLMLPKSNGLMLVGEDSAIDATIATMRLLS